VKEYVRSLKRPPLVRQLLAGAEALVEQGHGRAALTEAVTALEVAIHEFAKSQESKRLLAISWLKGSMYHLSGSR
jgi:hypothetical protein